MSPHLSIPNLPEGCKLTKEIRDARFRIAHVTRDTLGCFSHRTGWLITDVVCDDDSRVVIQYDDSSVFIDIPANEIVIISAHEAIRTA